MVKKAMEHHILPSLAKTTIVCNIWLMDALWKIWYLCASCQLHQQKMEIMSYQCGDLLGSWNNKGYHGFAIKGLAGLVWFVG
jgi:hypothetical protein